MKHNISIILLVFGCLAATPAWAAPVAATVNEGRLLGTEHEGVAVFKGIPYATPPTGAQRWRAPEAPSAWQGERLANRFSPQCIQAPYPEASMFTRPSPAGSEDCLYLNVWSANLGGAKPQAVMVWIHGGALTRGSGSTSLYDGSNLARKGVVVVTINYRLGAFGYLAHPALSEENKRLNGVSSSGNYGVLDQIAALKWVQANIAAFGGDPDRVTIFGESAGSWSVNYLTATPKARGLFQRAIGQSGASFAPMRRLSQDAPGLPAAETLGERLAENLAAKTLNELRALPAAKIQSAFDAIPEPRFAGANVDGDLFPDQIARIFERGEHNAVDLIVGSNADEGTNLMPPPKSMTASAQLFRQVSGPLAERAMQLYGFEDDWTSAAYDMFRDLRFTWNMSQWAEAAAQHGDRVYQYYFTFVPPAPLGDRLGAYHAAEIRYVFDNAEQTFNGAPATSTERALGATLSDYWVSFAKTGKPSAKGAASWPRYRARKPAHLLIAETPERRRGPVLPEQVALIDDLMVARYQRVAAAEARAAAGGQ